MTDHIIHDDILIIGQDKNMTSRIKKPIEKTLAFKGALNVETSVKIDGTTLSDYVRGTVGQHTIPSTLTDVITMNTIYGRIITPVLVKNAYERTLITVSNSKVAVGDSIQLTVLYAGTGCFSLNLVSVTAGQFTFYLFNTSPNQSNALAHLFFKVTKSSYN